VEQNLNDKIMSKISDDLLKQIQDEISCRGEIPNSLDELNRIAAAVTNKYNQSPNPDFEGLSPHHMYVLLNKPFSPECIVKIETSPETEIAATSPVIRICLLIIHAIKAQNGLTLTKGGKLPRKIVNEIYNLNIYKEENRRQFYKRVLNELDYLPSAITNALMRLSGVVIIRKNKLQLSSAGKKVAENPVLLFQILFTTFSTNFNKGYLDSYESESIGNLGTLYTVYLLSLFGKKQREASFYAQRYFKAFPELIKEITFRPYSTPEKSAYDCFIYRTFDKGLLLFGLIEIKYEGKDYLNRKIYVKTNELFYHVFKIA
jgi:hypothetical protein